MCYLRGRGLDIIVIDKQGCLFKNNSLPSLFFHGLFTFLFYSLLVFLDNMFGAFPLSYLQEQLHANLVGTPVTHMYLLTSLKPLNFFHPKEKKSCLGRKHWAWACLCSHGDIGAAAARCKHKQLGPFLPNLIYILVSCSEQDRENNPFACHRSLQFLTVP